MNVHRDPSIVDSTTDNAAVSLARFSEAQCLQFVQRSPEAVAAHDKAGWLSIFAAVNIVEDPVGSAPHLSGVYDRREGRRGHGPLSRFYDTFIAPNSIKFHVERDIVCGLNVVRDLTIEIAMSPKVTVRVPMHLLYELKVEYGQLKVFRLAAHWELAPMLKQQMSFGIHSLIAGTVAAGRMVRYLGLSGMLKFGSAVSCVGDAGKQRVTRFIDAFNSANEQAVTQLFAQGENSRLAFPVAQYFQSVGDCLKMGGKLSVGKTLAAGNFVTASCSYCCEGEEKKGVIFFEINRKTLLIEKLDCYWS